MLKDRGLDAVEKPGLGHFYAKKSFKLRDLIYTHGDFNNLY